MLFRSILVNTRNMHNSKKEILQVYKLHDLSCNFVLMWFNDIDFMNELLHLTSDKESLINILQVAIYIDYQTDAYIIL